MPEVTAVEIEHRHSILIGLRGVCAAEAFEILFSFVADMSTSLVHFEYFEANGLRGCKKLSTTFNFQLSTNFYVFSHKKIKFAS